MSDGSWANGRVRVIRCEKQCTLARWGLRCCRIEGDKPVLLWLSEYNPQILTVDAEIVGGGRNAVDLRKCQLLRTAMIGAENEMNLLFTDNARTLQVVLKGVSNLEKPIIPRCTLHGTGEFTTKPLTLQRLCCLYQRGRLVKSLYPGQQRAHHWIKMLRACDGLHSGAHHREIGAAIFGEQAVRDGWDAGYRTRVQRLIRSARKMIDGGYLKLLL